MKCGELQLTSQLVVRASPELIDLVRKVAEARGEYVADLVRRAVKTELARLSFLSDFEKKALGVERVVRREATHRIQEARE
jgi:leucyl aminopeptidase (aminopeptidase T)